VRGDVDAEARSDLSAVGVVADNGPGLTVDLADLGYVDAVGVDLLEELAQRPNVDIRNPTAPLVRLLRRTANVMSDWEALRAAVEDDR
jgi:hypothetical protein